MKTNVHYSKKQKILKNVLFSLFFTLVTFVIHAQVGIGTFDPSSSAQLHIVAEDRGILIPQVPLINSTDMITISNGNEESLLVYNINTQNDVSPGYYYWKNNRWNRLVSSGDGTGHLSLSDNILNYSNLDGTFTSIDLGSIILANQSITQLIDNGDGTITYIDENEIQTTINLAVGTAGLSAYEIAVNNGFTGTEEDWLDSLQGATGIDGQDGLSAYEIAVNNGFTGTEEDWLISLQGVAGIAGQDGSDGVAGIDGLSAYEIAVNNGFVGTESEWLNSLQGSDANVTLIDGTNTIVQSTTSEGATQWQVNVATATGTTLGVVKEAETNPTVNIDTEGTLSVNLEALNDIKQISGTYQVQLTDNILLGDASTADVTVLLPSAEDNKGKTFTIKKQDANEDYFVNVYGNISGLSQLYTALPYSGWVLVSDGTQWRITNKF